MFRPTLNLATSPKPDEAVEAARARLEAERGMFIGNYMKNAEAARRSEAIASDFVDVDGPGRRGMRRVATSEVTIDPVAIEQEAKSAWKAELQTRLANIQSAKYAKIVSAVEAGARMAEGETPESFAARKTALVQKLSRERGLPVTPAESDLIGPVSMLGEAGRSMARFAKMAAQTPGVIGQVAGEIVPMLGDPLSRMATAVGIPGMASRMGQAVNQAIDVAVPSEGIQPSMAVQREGVLPDRVSSVPRWLAARGPEAAGSLAATLIPGAAVGRAMGAGAGMATAMGVGTGLEVQGAFDDAMQGYLSQGVPEPVARQRAAGEAVVYGAISSVLEKFPAAEFLLKSQEGRRLLTRLGRGAFIEGSTEASQELAQALTQVAGGSAPDAMNEIGSKMAASGILGGLMGGAAGVLAGGVPRGTSQQTVRSPMPEQPAPPVQPGAEQAQPPPEQQTVSPPPQIAPETVAAVVQAVQNGLIPADHPAALAVASQIQAAQAPAESPVVQPTTIEATPDVQDQEPSGRSEAVDVQQGGTADLADGRGVGDLPVADAAPPDGGEDQRAGDLAPTADAGAAAQPAAAPAVVGVQQQPAPREAPPQVLKPSRGEYSKRSMIERIAADPFIEGAVQSEIDALDPEQLAQRAEGTSATTVQDIRFGKGVTQDVREGFSGATPQARVFQPDEQTLDDVFGGDVGKARESAEMMAAGQAGRRRRAVRIAGSGSVAGQPAMLAYQLRLIEREGPADAVQVVTNPVGLPDGTVVSISGVEHTVGRDAQGKKVLAGPGAVRLGLAGVERMYVDQGSIRMGGEQTISEPEVVDDLPISPSRRPRISDRASASAAKLGNRLRRGESFRVVEPATRGDRQAVAVAKRLGIEPVFFEGNVPYEGLVDPENPGVVFLESGQTVQNVRRLLTHEWAHTLKKNDPQAFNDLANRIEAVMPGELARSLERYRKRLRDAGMDDSRVAQGTDIGLEEAVAELLGDHADKAGFWSQLAGGEASVWQRIVDALRRLVTRVGLTSPVARELLRTVEAATAKVEAARGRSAAGVAKAAGKSSPMFSPAWHGSPHKFDRFSTDKIGTGEGNQAYGHGLYFASAREVAEHYRHNLSARRAWEYEGRPIDFNSEIEGIVMKAAEHLKAPPGRSQEHNAKEIASIFRYEHSVYQGRDLPKIVADRIANRNTPEHDTANAEIRQVVQHVLDGLENHVSERAAYRLALPEGARTKSKMSEDEKSALFSLEGRLGWFNPDTKTPEEAMRDVRTQLQDTIESQTEIAEEANRWRGEVTEEDRLQALSLFEQAALESGPKGISQDEAHNVAKSAAYVATKPEGSMFQWAERRFGEDGRWTFLNNKKVDKALAILYPATEQARYQQAIQIRKQAEMELRILDRAGTSLKRVEKPGRLYKVDLKPAEDEYLLWDKPIYEQSEKVQNALRLAAKNNGPAAIAWRWGTRYETEGRPHKWNGANYYAHLGDAMAERNGLTRRYDKHTSEYLKSLGIRGIKYLDGSSRSDGDGSYNYVIFDDADVEIEMMMSPKPTRKDIDKAGRKAGKEDYGRPDLANVGTGEAARAEIDKYDEYAKRNEPSVLAVDMAKARRLAADPKSVLDAMRKSVASNSDAETVEEVHAAKFVVDALAAQAALSKSDADTAAAYDAHSLYRRQGTVSGRKLQARFDPVRSRDRRIVSDLYRSMMEPAPKVLERLEKLEKTATDPNAAVDDVRKAKAEIGKIRDAEIERIKAVKEAIREAGLLDQLQRAENISKGSESAQVAAEAISVREREELNRKIAESDARLAEAEKSLLEAQGKILELKGESAEVRKLREDAQAQIDKNKAEAEKNKKEADRLRRQRADIAQREAALAQQIINWADGKGYNPADVVVIPGVEKPGGGGGGKGGGVSAPAFNPDAKRILAMPGQLDLGGSTESGALTVKGGPETPTFSGSGQEIVSQTGLQKNLPGLDATYEGGDIPAFVARTQTLIALPDGRLLTASEFYQVLKGVPDTAAWSDGPKGAGGSQRIMPFEAIEEAKEIVKASKELDGWDAAIEFFRNSILSAPKTLIVNFTSTQLNAWYEVFAVRALKAAVNQIPELFGGQRIDPDGPTFGEFKAMYAAIGKSYARATLGFLKTFDTERPSFETEVRYASKLSKGESVSDISYLQPPAIKGTKGRVVRLPQRVMGASDEMAVAWVTTLDAAARAHRIARQEGLVGAAAGNRIADIMDDPSHPVWMESLNEAARVAFKSPAAELGGLVGPVAQALLKARVYIRKMPYVGGPLSLFLVMPHVPFVTTPANIMRAVANMTPLVAVRAGSRMFKAATGQQAYTREMMLDDAARGIIVTGVMLATAALLADDEDGRPRLTGRSPSSQAERERWKRLGILPYSVRVGDTYVSYERYEPFSTALAATIDMVQAAGSAAEGDVGAAAQQLGTGGMAILTDKSYLTGLADLVKLALDVGQGRGSLGVQTYLANYFRPWVPNLMRSTMREFDPAVRETATLGPKGEHGFFGGLGRKAVYGLVPSLAQRDLEPKYDLWGREIRKASDAGPILGPVMRLSLPNDWAVSPNDDAAKLDLMIGLVNQKYRDTPEKQLNFVTPEDTLTVDGDRTPMTKTEYAFFLRESGLRALERLVDKGLDYENPGEREQKAVRREVREAREWARRQLVKERKEKGAARESENAEQE